MNDKKSKKHAREEILPFTDRFTKYLGEAYARWSNYMGFGRTKSGNYGILSNLYENISNNPIVISVVAQYHHDWQMIKTVFYTVGQPIWKILKIILSPFWYLLEPILMPVIQPVINTSEPIIKKGKTMIYNAPSKVWNTMQQVVDDILFTPFRRMFQSSPLERALAQLPGSQDWWNPAEIPTVLKPFVFIFQTINDYFFKPMWNVAAYFGNPVYEYLVAVYKYVMESTIVKSMIALFDMIQRGINATTNAIASGATTVLGTVNDGVEMVESGAEAVGDGADAAEVVAVGAGNGMLRGLKTVKKGVVQVENGVSSAASKVENGISFALSTVEDGVVSVIAIPVAITDMIFDTISGVKQGIRNEVGSAFQELKAELGDQIQNTREQLIQDIKDTYKNQEKDHRIVNDAVKTMTDSWKDMVGKLKNMAA